MLPLSPVLKRALLTAPALLLCMTSAEASHLRHGPTAGKPHGKKKHSTVSKTAVSARPRAMDDARATEIQTALVKAGYLDGASGHWDDASAAAMRKLQGDNGWQTKLIPDSRALIKLGLGPGGDTSAKGGVSNVTGSPRIGEPASAVESGAEQK